jgi:hypothetical protein
MMKKELAGELCWNRNVSCYSVANWNCAARIALKFHNDIQLLLLQTVKHEMAA